MTHTAANAMLANNPANPCRYCMRALVQTFEFSCCDLSSNCDPSLLLDTLLRVSSLLAPAHCTPAHTHAPSCTHPRSHPPTHSSSHSPWTQVEAHEAARLRQTTVGCPGRGVTRRRWPPLPDGLPAPHPAGRRRVDPSCPTRMRPSASSAGSRSGVPTARGAAHEGIGWVIGFWACCCKMRVWHARPCACREALRRGV